MSGLGLRLGASLGDMNTMTNDSMTSNSVLGSSRGFPEEGVTLELRSQTTTTRSHSYKNTSATCSGLRYNSKIRLVLKSRLRRDKNM